MKLPLPDSATTAGRLSRVTIAAVAGGGLALGIAGIAHADPTPTPSASADAATPTPTASGSPWRAHTPRLWGTVTSIDGNRVLIVDPQGFTRQINIGTVPSDVKVDARVLAEGAVNADGVSLDATSITVAPDRPEGRRGPGGYGPRGSGPGGFGPRGSGPGGYGPGGYGQIPGPYGHPGDQGEPVPSESPAPSESVAPSPTS